MGVFDNTEEFLSLEPYIHYLRDLGYATCLVGKTHFVGFNQLHSFEHA